MKRTMKRLGRRVFALFLAAAMGLGMMPEMTAQAAENGSTVVKSAFEDATNLDQSDTCYGTITLDGGSVTDSGTPNVWPTGNWEGSVDVTGYSWVHITSTNPDVASASYRTDGGRLSITFTPGTKSGTTKISVGVDAKYPHYSLGTWNMNLNFDYTVTNVNGESAGSTSLGSVSRSVTYDLNTGKATWGRGNNASNRFDTYYGERSSIGVGIVNTCKVYQGYYTYTYEFYAESIDHISVGGYDTSIATVEAYQVESQTTADDVGNPTMKGVGIKVTGLKAGITQVTVTPEFKIPTTTNGQNAYIINRSMPITVYIKVSGDVVENTYTLNYDSNGGSFDTNGGLTVWADKRVSKEGQMTFAINETTPVRTGYKFKGWSDSATAQDAQYTSGSFLTLTKDSPTKTIFAVWEEDAGSGIDNTKITVTKTPSKEYPEVGEEFKYTIEMENDNDQPVVVTVTDKLNEKLDFVKVSHSDGGV